ncbi:DNA topoisomerase (ATP-hydrolyzing) [Oceanirhabdus sp. W0125-5]|uniref:DNA topoisomerase (ATP-hydrolyzing) n=1 Tax=Oceanirhabdus sp. W0125-5 TaxID=2999116 RepID=UPI0022F333C9|nr:DNA topoisomerase (ATP-hydrolyzing) [Oceanirhabdus sp. W0125-5]WBW95498.1 DNA topoisomerase 4 subunit A [Oceanirhabdus sp. W0125-5]
MGKKYNVPKDNNILKISLDEAMSENYLPYAVEVAKDRALPDVRDGLKPVHRRILYGAYNLKASPDKPYLKSARIVGDILGKYHPHGDSSVYEAMVILAQDFSTRNPLIDGHGNWGSVDGDSAAAMRYTEARLSQISMEMLRDIDKDVVDMVDNYSDTEKEPAVLPARFPNLLVNGAFGIAVGLSTNIPPHNLGEVIDGVVALSKDGNLTNEGLMEYIKGPDLPTAGMLIGSKSIKHAYETGKGRVPMRAKATIEELENGRMGIVITEFPYRKNKAKLLQIISDMTGDKKHSKMLEGIVDIRDESDRHGIRSVIEFKKSADRNYIEKTLKYLYKKTDLQCNVNFNMIALVDGKPELLDLKSMLSHYLDHQKEVITRRTRKALEVAETRFHIVEGLIKAIGIMDEVIKTIRESKSKKDANTNLQEKFGFSNEQATAILEMMLYKLTGLEIVIFQKEHDELQKAISKYKKILNSENELLKVFRKEILEIKDKYADDRRTMIIENEEDAKIDTEELIIIEDIVITVSKEGYVKRIPLKSYNRTSGDVNDIEYREGDYNIDVIHSNTKDNIIIFTDDGNSYRIQGIDIPEKKWKDKGEKLDSLIKGFDSEKNNIIAVYSIKNYTDDKEFMFFSKNGGMRSVPLSEFKSNYAKISSVNVKKDDKLVDVKFVEGSREKNFIKVITSRGLNYVIEEPEIEASTRNSVLLSVISIPDGDYLKEIDLSEEFVFETFPITVNKKGEVFKEWKRSGFKSYTETNGRLLFIFENGNMVTVPSYMLQNIEGNVQLDMFIPEHKNFGSLILLHNFSKFDECKQIILPTKKGLIKRCKTEEILLENYGVTSTKVLSDDYLLKPEITEIDKDGDLIVITSKGRVLKFTGESLSMLGKNAKGVTSISLKEDDTVEYVAFLSADSSNEVLTVKYKNGKNDNFEIESIPLKNRASVGAKIISSTENDGIKDIFMI